MITASTLQAGEEITKSAGSAAWDKAKELYKTTKAKFSDKAVGSEVLDDLAKTPEDPDIQAAVRAQLKKEMLVDEIFAKRLANILKEAAEVNKWNRVGIQRQ